MQKKRLEDALNASKLFELGKHSLFCLSDSR
jgi:hypothetical protein